MLGNGRTPAVTCTLQRGARRPARMGEAVGESAAGNSEHPNVSLRAALGASSGRSDEESLQNSFFSVLTLIKIHYFDVSCSKPVSRGEAARLVPPFAPASSC